MSVEIKQDPSPIREVWATGGHGWAVHASPTHSGVYIGVGKNGAENWTGPTLGLKDAARFAETIIEIVNQIEGDN